METTKLLDLSGERGLSFLELGWVKILKDQDQDQDQLQTVCFLRTFVWNLAKCYLDLFLMDWRRRLWCTCEELNWKNLDEHTMESG